MVQHDARIVTNVGYRSPRSQIYSGRMTRLNIRIAATTVIFASMMLTGCSAATMSESSDAGGPLPAADAPEFGSKTDEGGVLGPDSDVESGRQVISTGTVSITADDPIEAAADAVEIVEDAGGRIDSRSEQPATDDEARADDASDSSIYPGPGLPAPSAQLVVRIPSEKLTATLDEIKKLGEVESVAIDANDVTAQSLDLESRVTALRASVDRLVGLLAGATTTKDLIDIETALSTRQAELESLESQQRSLIDQVDLSTVSITFGSVASAPVEQPSDFFSGITAGWQTLVAFVGGVLVALGFLLPWLIVLAVIGTVVLLLARRRVRRRRLSAPVVDSPDSVPPVTPEDEVSTRME